MWNIENKIEPTYERSQKYSLQINKNYVNESKVEPIVFAPSVDQWTKKALKLLRTNIYQNLLTNMRIVFWTSNNQNKRRRLESMSKLKQ